ncbi:MAG TPA: energy-coupled thiamine transporter ThiT [Symbiobacteriaceae bacterium]|nr:energy-coupled thiamine transporter ThiT [Symbiobacteriaceae bacterium]
MSRSRLSVIAEIAVMVALSTALSLLPPLFTMPQGGTVTWGSMVPILLVGLRHGTKWGVVAGVLTGVLNFIVKPYSVHPIQVLLDYPIAFGMIGLAGLAAGKSETMGAVLGSFALFGRFVAHVLSGVVFFAEYAGGQNVWVYSIIYNGSYMLPELAISAVLLTVLLPALRRALPPTSQRAY